MDPAARVPPSVQHGRALVVDLGPVAGQRPLAPVQDAQQGQQERARSKVGHAGALGNECLGVPGPGLIILGEPLTGILSDPGVVEAAEPIAGEQPVVQPRLVVADHS